MLVPMRSITAICLAVCLMALGSCSPGRNPPPTAKNSDGQSLMVMYDCQGDCEEPAVGFGGRFYVVACDEIKKEMLTTAIAVADPRSPLDVPYAEARPIRGIDPAEAVALGPASPSWCRPEQGWWAARSLDHLHDERLESQLQSLAP